MHAVISITIFTLSQIRKYVVAPEKKRCELRSAGHARDLFGHKTLQNNGGKISNDLADLAESEAPQENNNEAIVPDLFQLRLWKDA